MNCYIYTLKTSTWHFGSILHTSPQYMTLSHPSYKTMTTNKTPVTNYDISKCLMSCSPHGKKTSIAQAFLFALHRSALHVSADYCSLTPWTWCPKNSIQDTQNTLNTNPRPIRKSNAPSNNCTIAPKLKHWAVSNFENSSHAINAHPEEENVPKVWEFNQNDISGIMFNRFTPKGKAHGKPRSTSSLYSQVIFIRRCPLTKCFEVQFYILSRSMSPIPVYVIFVTPFLFCFVFFFL